MARTMRSIVPGSCRKCWPKRFLARLTGRRAAQSSTARRSGRAQAAGIRAARAREVECGAVIHRGAHDRQPERHVHGVAEAARFSTGRPWSWYIASTASWPASRSGRNAVSAGTGPVSRRPVGLQPRAAPGSMTSISSRPRWPPSPACGLRPQTRMRGAAMPNFARRSASRIAQHRREPFGRERRAHRGERQVRGGERDAQAAAGQHHHGQVAPVCSARYSVWPVNGHAGVVDHALVHRRGDHRVEAAGEAAVERRHPAARARSGRWPDRAGPARLGTASGTCSRFAGGHRAATAARASSAAVADQHACAPASIGAARVAAQSSGPMPGRFAAW